MSREIKFRAFHTTEKIFWYFNLVTVRTSKAIDRDWFRLEPAQQFTGLKDKNGKEIYEGDIIKRWAGNVTVIWEQESAAFCLKWSKDTTDLLSLFVNESPFEVIGNIYENPELLKP